MVNEDKQLYEAQRRHTHMPPTLAWFEVVRHLYLPSAIVVAMVISIHFVSIQFIAAVNVILTVCALFAPMMGGLIYSKQEHTKLDIFHKRLRMYLTPLCVFVAFNIIVHGAIFFGLATIPSNHHIEAYLEMALIVGSVIFAITFFTVSILCEVTWREARKDIS